VWKHGYLMEYCFALTALHIGMTLQWMMCYVMKNWSCMYRAFPTGHLPT